MSDGLHVLLVDDDQAEADQLDRDLRQGGYEPLIRRVATAEALGEALGGGAWDVVIAAYQLAHFGGLDALAVLHASGQDIPLVLLSEAVDEDTAIEALVRGARDFIRKDRRDRLLAAVERELVQARLRRELRRREQMYHDLVHSTRSIIVRWDHGGRITFANEFAQSFFGYTEEEILGRRLVETIVPATDAAGRDLAAMIEAIWRDPDHHAVNENENIDRQGERRWVSWTHRAIRDAAGGLVEIVSVGTDCTERKRAEQALRESEESFRKVFDEGPIGMVLTTRELRIVRANLAFCRMVGRTPDELHAMTFLELTHPDHRGVDREQVEALWAGRTLQYRTEKRYVAKDGTVIWGTLWSALIQRADGAPRHAVAIVEDITDRKQAEDALRESEARFRSLVESAPEAIFVQSQDCFVYLNPAALRLLGAAQPADLLGTNFMERMAPECHETIRERVRLQHMTGDPAPLMEQTYLRLDGSRVPVETTAVAVRYEGSDAHLVFVRDITERKRAEAENATLQAQLQQAQKLESVGRLAGGVAHDFNNMLGVILGHAELALEALEPDHPLHTDILEIQRAAQRSAELTRQLLAFARQQTVAPVVLDLNETAAGMHLMLQRLIGEHLRLELRPGADLWPVRADPTQIGQVLTNLCVNARDAIADVGTIIVETGNCAADEQFCDAHPGLTPGQYVRLAVTDDGCGMDPATLARIFEPFYTTKDVGKGTGLGLAMVYGAVKQNGGFIHVESEPGTGTSFAAYLPRYVGRPGSTAVEGGPTAAQRGHATILLVEDEPSLLTLTQRMLQRHGYTVLPAATPGEAMRVAREHVGEIQLLLTDVVMPEMNGRDLARNLLPLYPGIRRLFTSGYTADAIAHHGVLEPGVHFLQKPFTAQALLAKVAEVLACE